MTRSFDYEKHLQGALDGSGLFNADTILAKHDETYMPRMSPTL